jgi:serine protease inhibitor ecotin
MCLARDMAALWLMEIATIAAAARAGSRPRKKAMPYPRGSDGLNNGTLALEDFRREETRSR